MKIMTESRKADKPRGKFSHRDPNSNCYQFSANALSRAMTIKKNLKQLESAFPFRTITACLNLWESFFWAR